MGGRNEGSLMAEQWLVAKYVNPEVTEAFEILDMEALAEAKEEDKLNGE